MSNTIKKWQHDFFVYRAKALAGLTYRYLLNKKYHQKTTKQASTPPSILHINTFDSGGGAAKIAHALFSYQKNIGLNAGMLVGKKKLADDSIIQIPRVTTRKQHFLTAAQETLQWQDFFHLSSLDIEALSSFQKADIIHLHNIHGNYFSPFAIPLISSQKTVFWTLHDMQAFTGHCAHSFDCEKWQYGCGTCPDLSGYPTLTKDTTNFIWRTKKKIYEQSKLNIVVPSDWLKKKVEKSILSHFSLHTIHNGINTTVYAKQSKHKAREKLGVPQDKKVVLFSAEYGINNPFKGGLYVKNIIENNDNNDVLFINTGGSKIAEREERIWNLPYINNEEEMVLYYNAADIYLYPSLADNCPLVVLEAMACGLPVLTFNTGGVPELVEHNATGYVAEYKNTNDLINGLTKLLSDPSFAEQLSKRGIERVDENFTSEKMNEKYLTLYKQL